MQNVNKLNAELFFSKTLIELGQRLKAGENKSQLIRLDKNEMPVDLPDYFKELILDDLKEENWNRYPPVSNEEIEHLIASHINFSKDFIVIAPGSANIITTLLNYFAINNKDIIIASPSYTLFDYHCKTYGIEYKKWMLNDDLGFDVTSLNCLDKNSVVFLATPNNPVGNIITYEDIETLVKKNPETLFVLDNVYQEYTEINYTKLLFEYQNLIIIRSFSKAFHSAGIRLGYLVAHPEIAMQVRKLILQFSINYLSLSFAKALFKNRLFIENSKLRIIEIIQERNSLFKKLSNSIFKQKLKVWESHGNFLLIRILNQADFDKLMLLFNQKNIRVLNTSALPLLENTFRVSIGTSLENDFFYKCLHELLATL